MSSQSTILDEIIENKRTEVEASKASVPLEELVERAAAAEPARDFLGALRPAGRSPRIVAEIKKASPSRGVLREDFDPAWIAREYTRGGAAAISVLTDSAYFQGRLAYLRTVKASSPLPVLRKDFITDPYQVYESRAFGADALLLIAAALSPSELSSLLGLTHTLGMNAIVEVHDEDELGAALGAGSGIIGINNRDLRTFEVDTDVTVRLAGGVPSGTLVISESGIGRDNIAAMVEQGIRAFLIGESFMKAPSPGDELAALLELAG